MGSQDLTGTRAIIIDDGIATGNTTVACICLIEKLGGSVTGVLAIINHTYASRNIEMGKYPSYCIFDL